MDISDSIERAISAYFSQLVFAHPYLAWTISHPLPSLGLLFLAIFSLRGLFKAIGWGIDRVWLFLLTTPFKLLQPIFQGIWSLIRSRFGHNNPSREIATPTVANPANERIVAVVDRLQQLSQEQDILLQELATLTNSASVATQLDRVSDTQYKNMYAKLLKLNRSPQL
jgi:hypothetical protein